LAPARRHLVRGSWQPPTYDGDSQINSYAVTPFQGTTALTPVTGSNEPAHGHGPNGNTTYTFSVAATNAQRHWCAGGHGNHTDDAVPIPGATNV